MSNMAPTPTQSTPDTSRAPSGKSSQTSKPQRVLACVLCQQRKLKCDRKFPCAHCVKSRTQCVTRAQAPRRRRQKFPDRQLLERLGQYEELLRKNNIKFAPPPKISAAEGESSEAKGDREDDVSDDEQQDGVAVDWSTPSSTTFKYEKAHDAKDIWHAMTQFFRDQDNDSDGSYDNADEVVVKKAIDQSFGDDGHLLFGLHKTGIELYSLRPDPVQIFRLWQIYLDNVNPLLKVTHAPSLQRRIIEAASNIATISPTLEALMFGIYCMAIQSLVGDDVHAQFGSSKEELLTRYQYGCQQALSRCRFLRSSDCDCLTALYLYLISIGPSTNPQSLSSMAAIAIRIAQRIGIHSESANGKCTAFEAERRRRLWWSLMLFDTRIGEQAGCKFSTLAPTWDCNVPLNVNDSDLRSEMKEPPAVQEQPTEALFAVVRSEVGDFVRHTRFHLDFTSPAMKPLVTDTQQSTEGSELDRLETTIEDKYLRFCNEEEPLHFMTLWTTRGYLAKARLLEYYSKYSRASVHQTDTERNAAVSYALIMLECDTKLMASSLTKRFIWLIQFYFPFLAYIQLVQDMSRRPLGKQAEQAWEVMSDNYEARILFAFFRLKSALLDMFSKIVLGAWETREGALRQAGEPSMTPPRIVSHIRRRMAERTTAATEQPLENLAMSMPISIGSNSLPYGMGQQELYPGIGIGEYSQMPGQDPLDLDMNLFDWPAMNWDLVNVPASDAAGSRGP